MNTEAHSFRLSIIIPTCRRIDMLGDCLARIVTEAELCTGPDSDQLSGRACEIIVTDDDHEGSANALLASRFPSIRFISGPRRGPAANRNNGAAHARGEWLVFIDDDCVPSEELIRAYLSALACISAPVLEGRTLPLGERSAADDEAPVNENGGYLWSCNFGIRRDLFMEMGGFDIGFPGAAMEDVEFHTRLRNAGIPIQFVSDAVVWHPWRRRKGGRFVSIYVNSVMYYCKKHPDKRTKFSLRARSRTLVRRLLVDLPRDFRKFSGRGCLRSLILEIRTFVELSAVQMSKAILK